jgi:hypothetical protein
LLLYAPVCHGSPRIYLGDALDAPSASEWETSARALNEEKLDYFRERVSEGAGDLLRAARDHAPKKLPSLISALYGALDDITREFGLEKALKAVQKGRTPGRLPLRWVRRRLERLEEGAARKPGRPRVSPGSGNGS